ncbi:MAG: iron uptake porin [Cuspidothrix sp.]
MAIKISGACGLGILHLLALTLPAQAIDGFAEGFANSEEYTSNHQNITSAEVSQPTLTAETVPSATQKSTNTDSSAGQVTSVSQLSDVQPRDWAFSALQSLVERYGCIAGYPNGTFRGNRALSRYEFAAGLNACLDRINELLATATADLPSKQDIATLKKLQEDFAAELTGVSGILANGGRSISFLSADTYTNSRGGDIYLSTPLLTLQNGGIISAGSLGAGDAGNITIDAGRVQLLGIQNPGELNSRIQASVGIVGEVTNPNATANAGSLNLNVQELLIANESTINVQSLGTGKAGSINILADAMKLNNKGSINGSTDAGGGGNVNITATELQLRRGSQITTDGGSSDGGNININSEILLAFPQENSDITANARTAQGGKVTVNVPYIFGFSAVSREQVRERLGLTDAKFAALQVNPTSLLNTSDIAAFSQVSGPSLQGTVTFSTSGVNPAQGLVEIPQTVVDPNTLIAANPCTRGAGSEFSITGRGGVPPSPNDVLSGNSGQSAWVEEAGVQGSKGAGEQGCKGAGRKCFSTIFCGGDTGEGLGDE